MLTNKKQCDAFHVAPGKTVSKSPVYNNEIKGLRLTARRTATGETKTWSFVLRGIDKTLGHYHEFSLQEARAWHSLQFKLFKNNGEVSSSTSAPPTLGLLFADWVETKCPLASRPGRRSVWNKHCKPLHDLPISALNWHLVYNHVETMGEPTNAGHRILQIFKALSLLLMNRYGIGSSAGGPIPTPPKLSTVFDRRKTNEVIARKRNVTLPAALWRELWHKLGNTPAHCCLRFIMLTGCRKGEAAGICWDEIDLDNHTWTLPAARSKTGAAKVYPLPPVLVDLLKEWEYTRRIDEKTGLPCGAVFGSIGHSTINHSLERLLGKGSGFTVHDLRRTFATLCGEHITDNILVIDKMLNHAPPSRLIAIYQPHALEALELATWKRWHIWADSFL